MNAPAGLKSVPYELPKVPAQSQEHLDICVRALEDLFTVGPDGTTAFAPTGEPYVAYFCDGPKAQGSAGQWFDPVEGRYRAGATLHLDVDNAVRAFVWMMRNERDRIGGKPTLYWRRRPELGHFYREIIAGNGATYRIPVWDVYARFLMTHKPPED